MLSKYSLDLDLDLDLDSSRIRDTLRHLMTHVLGCCCCHPSTICSSSQLSWFSEALVAHQRALVSCCHVVHGTNNAVACFRTYLAMSLPSLTRHSVLY